MAAEPERKYLKDLDPQNYDWAKNVDKMSDEMVIQVYLERKAEKES